MGLSFGLITQNNFRIVECAGIEVEFCIPEKELASRLMNDKPKNMS